MTRVCDKNKPTIIHLLSHRPNPVCLKYKDPEEYIKKHSGAGYLKIDKYPYWIGFFDDFNHKMAVDILEVTDKYNMECWRPYWGFIDRIYENVHDGVLHKVFPSRIFKIPRTDSWETSKMCLNELKKRINSGEKILLHIHDGHSNFITWLLLKLKPLKIPVLYQHRGGWLSNFDYIFRKNNPVFLFTYKKQLKAFKYISHYFSGSKIEFEFLKYIQKLENMSFYMDGVDFDYFKPGNKVEIRKKLNLPLDKKIILYVGRFDASNGVDNLVKVFYRLRKEYTDLQLLMVGGYKHNPSYRLALDAGAIMVERVPEPELINYYQASDMYVLAIESYLYQQFGGFGTATIQALASGLPVLSYNIIHLPAGMDEINKIGRIFNSHEEFYQNAKYILEHLGEFKECREIAIKYYDKKLTMKNLLDYYELLFKRYYNE